MEIQIRTERMDAVAERGIAAHWRYKGVNQGALTSEMWLGRLRELMEDTPHALAQRFDSRPSSGEIFVFTPNGDLRKLPEGATVLDFAFDIHSNLGCSCSGGKINGRAVPIKETLHNGDIVEILTQKNQTPKADWLSAVKTAKARSKIKAFIREEQAKSARLGREELERKLKNWKFGLTIDEAVGYRVIDARWRQTAEGAFRVTIRIVAADTTGMANHITETVIRDLKLNIRSMNLASRGGLLTGTVDVEVPATSVVDTLVHAILRIKGVQKAFRTNG